LPWIEDDWDKPASSTTCRRCHTATGYKAMSANPATYQPADIDALYSYLEPATSSSNNGQNEALYCWACHSDYKGTLRNPGPITPGIISTGRKAGVPTYAKFLTMSNTNITFPDLGKSNVCAACHSGRASGGNIVYDSASTDFKNTSLTSSHYLTVAGVMFDKGTSTEKLGYELGGRNYLNPPEYEHNSIGLPGDGPCITCHMNTPEPHLFLPITEDEVTGDVTAITSTACATCHTDTSDAGPMTLSVFNSIDEEYHDALAALIALLQTRNIYYSTVGHTAYRTPYNPDYSEAGSCNENQPIRNWQSGGNQPGPAVYLGTTCCYAKSTSGDCSTATNLVPSIPGDGATGRINMGIVFNLRIMEYTEPGMFVHNSTYARRLIYDAIDRIDEGNGNPDPGTLNDSVKAYLSNLSDSVPYKAGAIAYILTSPTCVGAACRP